MFNNQEKALTRLSTWIPTSRLGFESLMTFAIQCSSNEKDYWDTIKKVVPLLRF
jgi:hypothetical protein